MAAAFTQSQFMVPGRYRVAAGVVRDLTRDVLSRFQRGTSALLAAGGQIPIILEHAPAGSDEGSPRDNRAAVVKHGVGWLNSVSVNPDGSLNYSAEITDPATAEQVRNGSIKFTSPEFRPNHLFDGQTYRDVFAHMALTPRPKNPRQGSFKEENVQAFSCSDGNAFQFSMADMETTQMAHDDEKNKFPPGTGNDDSKTDGSDQQTSQPDMPTSGDSKTAQTMQAVVAHLEEIGLKLTSDALAAASEGDNDTFMGLLLQALMASKSAKEKVAEEAASKKNDEDDIQDAPGAGALKEQAPPGTQQFSEAETMAMDKLKQATAGIVSNAGVAAITKLRDEGRMGKFAFDKLSAKLGSLQFSDDGEEEATMTVSEVIGLWSDGTADNQSLTGQQVEEHEHPKGSQWTEDTAKGDLSNEAADEAVKDLFERHPHRRRQTAGA